MKFLIVFGFVLFIVSAFIITYLLNEKTKAPDVDVDISGCGGCKDISCGHHPARKMNKEEK